MHVNENSLWFHHQLRSIPSIRVSRLTLRLLFLSWGEVSMFPSMVLVLPLRLDRHSSEISLGMMRPRCVHFMYRTSGGTRVPVRRSLLLGALAHAA